MLSSCHVGAPAPGLASEIGPLGLLPRNQRCPPRRNPRSCQRPIRPSLLSLYSSGRRLRNPQHRRAAGPRLARLSPDLLTFFPSVHPEPQERELVAPDRRAPARRRPPLRPVTRSPWSRPQPLLWPQQPPLSLRLRIRRPAWQSYSSSERHPARRPAPCSRLSLQGQPSWGQRRPSPRGPPPCRLAAPGRLLSARRLARI